MCQHWITNTKATNLILLYCIHIHYRDSVIIAHRLLSISVVIYFTDVNLQFFFKQETRWSSY